MTAFDFMQVCQFNQYLRILRTNDYGEEYLIAEGTKKSIIEEGMDEELFSQLNYNVLIIEQRYNRLKEHNYLLVKCEDRYFFRSDKKE